MLFEDFPLSQPIQHAIVEAGYQKATPVQEKVIPEILRRNDVIASARTGTGKTAAFAIPLLHLLNKNITKSEGPKMPLQVLVLSPTRELAVQIQQNIQNYGKYTEVKSGVVFGGASMQPQIDMLRNGVQILVATPGRLLDLRKQGIVDLEQISVLVLDEADLMLDMGFIDEVQKIIRLSPNVEQRLLFSATISHKVAHLAKSFLKEPVRIDLSASSAAPEVNQKLYLVPKPQKIELLLFVMRNIIQESSVLIFRRTKFGVEKALESLLKNGFQAEALHGDKSQSERSLALNRFKNKEVNILVATDVAARGLDIDLLDFVINFDIPNLPETYVHRIGRTGRAGNLGGSFSFCSADEKEYIRNIEKLIGEPIPVEEENPFLLDKNATPQVHKKKGSKHRKGRKGSGSKSNKKRWY